MNYTERLTKEIERVTLRGNADKETVRALAAIIFDMDQRLRSMEGNEPFEEVEAPKPTQTKTETSSRRVKSTTEEK